MPLRLKGEGVATAYAITSVGEVQNEMAHAKDSVKLLREKSPALAVPLREPEIIYIIGQGDIAMSVGTTDFRRIADLGYPGSKSRAGAVNWVFSVPYVLPELPPPDPKQRNVLRFMLHLRLRRHVYAYRDGEEQLVHQLAALLNQAGIPGRIHVGLGWSDLIVEGTFSRDSFSAFVRFMIFAHGLRFEIGPPDRRTQHPAIQRMLTVIGYVGEAPEFRGVQHVTFVRAVPGGYDDLTDLLEKFGEVHILDGKADFMIRSEADPPADWLRTHSTLGGDTGNKRLLQKVETHLVYLHASQFDNQSGLPRLVVDFGRNRLHRKGCNCKDKATGFGGLIENNMEKMGDVLLPREQAYAITNVLFLLGATLRDTSICCDARDAVIACYHGLLSIFDGIQEQGQLGRRTAAEIHARREQLAALWRRVDEWHRFTDLLLRQRTVGSFEELLGQTDRSVVYSGGVQKFLFLADELVGDFAKRLLTRFKVKFKDELRGKRLELPFFATIYDSVKTILSFRNGLVRVPTRNIFRLPLALAGLWHEVGVALFFGWYTEEIADLTPEPDRNAFLASLGDHFADVVVYLYGFGGNFDFFLSSMAHGFNEIYRDAEEIIRRYAYRQFLVRLYLVYELDWMRQALRDDDKLRLQNLFQPRTLAKFLSTQLEAEVNAVATRYDSLVIPPPYWGQLHLDVTTADFTLFHRNLYLLFINEPALTDPSKLNVAPFEDGLLKNFGPEEDLNAWFAALAYYVQAADRADDIPYFEMMASLGKSAAIEYHRRQMTDRSNTKAPAAVPVQPGA